ncbi:hypothetical protein H5410_046958, partial [Solanum commersonii]
TVTFSNDPLSSPSSFGYKLTYLNTWTESDHDNDEDGYNTPLLLEEALSTKQKRSDCSKAIHYLITVTVPVATSILAS